MINGRLKKNVADEIRLFTHIDKATSTLRDCGFKDMHVSICGGSDSHNDGTFAFDVDYDSVAELKERLLADFTEANKVGARGADYRRAIIKYSMNEDPDKESEWIRISFINDMWEVNKCFSEIELRASSAQTEVQIAEKLAYLVIWESVVDDSARDNADPAGVKVMTDDEKKKIISPFYSITDEDWTGELWADAAAEGFFRWGDAAADRFKALDDRYKTTDICDIAFNLNKLREWNAEREIWKGIPESIKTEELCLKALNTKPRFLAFFSDNEKTEAVCAYALERGGFLGNVPEELRTEDMCLKARSGLQYIPDNIRSTEFYSKLYEEYPGCFCDVPDEYKTYDMCLKEVSERAQKLEFVPEEFKTKELCEIAYKNDRRVFSFLPDEFKTEEMCMYAVQNEEWGLKYVPDKLKTAEMCDLALKKTPRSYYYVPDELLTEHICRFAVDDNALNLKRIPDKFKTYEICERAVSKRAEMIEFVPEKYKNAVREALAAKRRD